ncbi:hypothetical protein BC629DRAFT_756032 [Irpex lacteus]|nr:hypothetical protein BC629DRAFT_756032 [Irpex lacteus]
MLSMLERCQSLQTLKLHYVLDGSDPFDDDDERNADIYLPSLQSLHLADHQERLGWLFCRLKYPSRTIVRVEVVVGMMDPTVGEYLGERLLTQLGYDSAVQAVHLQVTDWETERPTLTLSCWPFASLPQPWKPFHRIGRELDLSYAVKLSDFCVPPRFQLALIMPYAWWELMPMHSFLEAFDTDLLGHVEYLGVDSYFFDCFDMLGKSMRPILQSMPNVTTLDLSPGVSKSFYRILQTQARTRVETIFGMLDGEPSLIFPDLRRINVPIKIVGGSTEESARGLQVVRALINARNAQGRLLGHGGRIMEVWLKDEASGGDNSFEKLHNSSEYAGMRELPDVVCKYWDSQSDEVRDMH